MNNQPERLLPLAEVVAMVGFKKSWIYNEIKANHFPKAHAFGAARRWKLSEVQGWIEEHTSAA